MSENSNTKHAYLNQLNDIQRKAVTETDRPGFGCCGPGFGKDPSLDF